MSDEQSIKVPLAEEEIMPRVVRREKGTVRIHKRVETHPVTEDIEVRHDRVSVDRVRKDVIVDERRDPWWDGDKLVIPVYEEVVVTETRLVLREEVRVQRTSSIETVTIEDEVRKDVIDIESDQD
jgi:stress response protein YsnF